MTSPRLFRGAALGVLAGLLGGILAAGLAAADPKAEQLVAIDNLLREGSASASLALRVMATSDPDLRAREHAILALAQIGKEDAIPTLVEIGTAPPSTAVQTAAFNAVYELRKRFPMKNPPSVTVKALSPIAAGQDMVFEATVVSPVTRAHARIGLRGGKTLLAAGQEGDPLPVYQGPLEAGKAVKVRASFRSDQPTRTQVRADVRVSLDAVDATTYSTSLYLELRDGSGSASPTPPDASGSNAPKTTASRQ